MRRSALIVLVLAMSGLAVAQDATSNSADWYMNQIIRDITFVGLDSVQESDLRPIVSPFIGETFTERRFQDLQRRLYAVDYFITMVPEALRPASGEGVIVQFTVTERPSVDEIRFEGNRHVRSADLLDAVLLKTGDLITLTKRRVDEQAIRDLYLERGYPDIEVTSNVEEVETASGIESVVVFSITEGEQITIREIRFSGNTFASESTLRGRMDSKAQNIFNSGVYQSRVLEEDRVRIEQYYHERGYIDAVVVDVTTELERDEEEEKTFMILTVFVEEGEQYTFGGISFEGNTIFTDDELMDLVRVREGSVLNGTRLQESIASVQDLYYQNGYIFNQFGLTEDRDEQALTLAVTLTVVENVRAHIENIIVRGNTKTLDHVIEREIPLEVGDVFNVARIREGIQNLTNLQYFSAINPETPQGSVEGLMDLVINVEEAQTADIRFGVSFGGSTEFPVSANVGWSDTNFRGMGQTFGFNVSASPIQQLLTLNFIEPWLGGEQWSLGANLSVSRSVQSGVAQDILAPIFDEDDINAVPDPFEGYYVFGSQTGADAYNTENATSFVAGDLFPDTVTPTAIDDYDLETDYQYAGGYAAIDDEYLMDYLEWSISAGASTGYTFRTPLGNLSLSGGLGTSVSYVGYDPEQTRPFSPELRENLDDWQWENTLSAKARLDRRRGLFLSPSSGYVVNQSAAFVGGPLFGDRHYIRTDTEAEVYATLFDLPVSELWNWKLVLAAHSGISFILPHFWVPAKYAGMGPVAGTDLLETNPMYIARGWAPETGGEALWNNWLELRMPIFEQVLWLDTFLDAVALWEDPAEMTTLGPENMLFSIGSGIRFTIPQFPIALYFTKRFKIEDGGVQWQQGDYFNRNSSATGGLDFVFAIAADFFY